MTRNATNKLLQQAKRLKNDEFYTQLTDIESELKYYEGQFRGKTVYCNCDDPQTSNFFRYFVLNFQKLGLRKLVASCYREQTLDLFSTEDAEHGFYFEYTGTEEISLNNFVYFKGDGDFRSQECVKLLKEADVEMPIFQNTYQEQKELQLSIIKVKMGAIG